MESHKTGPVTALLRELEKLQQSAKTLKADYLRSLADFDNFRRRKEKEFAELRETSLEPLMSAMIPVVENFTRALNSTPADSSAECVLQGVRMIHSQLMEALKKFGFEEFSCLNEQFDPRRCEATCCEESECHPENTVIAESGRGYAYRGRVLRPALVTVSRAKPDPDPAANQVLPDGPSESA